MMCKLPFASFSFLVLAVGCSSTSVTSVNANSSTGGASAAQTSAAVGGDQTSGGATSGRTGTGGLTAITGGTGGGSLSGTSGGNTVASGGSTGGTSAAATGGFTNVATGGSTNITSGGATSAATGGTTAAATGGFTNVATGGSTRVATGGSSAVATGGFTSVATGGSTAVATGGFTNVATGGTPSSGGTTATGGSIASGGSSAKTGGTSSLGGTGGKPAAIRVLPLGDGITASTCYRAKLWQQLVTSGRTNFDFTGTLNTGDACNVSANYDKDNEGHAGYLASNVLQTGNTDLTDWFTGRPADIALMQMGANDILGGVAQADIISAYGLFLSALRAQNSKVKVFIALIMPMSANKCGSACAASVQALNDAISNWAPSVSTTASPVSVVALYTNFDVNNTTDGIKPDETGSTWVANRWYLSINALIN